MGKTEWIFFDLQLQWHWVWLFKMGSSYTVMVLQRKMWKRKFQHWSTTSGQFMTDSIIPLQLILVAQLCIYLPTLLMIDPARIKEPNIPQICSHITSLLPLKITLVLWPPLLIIHISFLLMILILYVLWINMCLSTVG